MNRIIQAMKKEAYSSDMLENICEDFYNGIKAMVDDGDYTDEEPNENSGESAAYVLGDFIDNFVQKMNTHTKNMLLNKYDIPEDKLVDKILSSGFGEKAFDYIENAIINSRAGAADLYNDR